MKKLIGLIACLCVIFTGSAFAADGTAWTSGTSAAGGSITFNPSSSTTITCDTDGAGTAFSIVSGSAKNDADVGMEYGIISWSNAVYQRSLLTAKTVAEAAVAALPGANWQTKTGATPPPS